MRSVMIFLCLLVLVSVGMTSVSCSSRDSWTSSSEEAIREFESGLESRMKLYAGEANEHFERALELDPDFVVAKLQLVRYIDDKERIEKLMEIRS